MISQKTVCKLSLFSRRTRVVKQLTFTFRKLSCAVFTFAASAMVAFAQVESGTITGIVTDRSSAVIAGARVQVLRIATNEALVTKTANDGAYTATNLPVGRYEVKVEMTGFKTAVQRDLPMEIGRTVRANVVLEIGDASEKVEVRATAPLLDSDTPSFQQSVDRQRLENLPLNARDFTQFASLAAGV